MTNDIKTNFDIDNIIRMIKLTTLTFVAYVTLKSKIRGKLFLCFAKYHAMKTYPLCN
jgi:hypothetical protein